MVRAISLSFLVLLPITLSCSTPNEHHCPVAPDIRCEVTPEGTLETYFDHDRLPLYCKLYQYQVRPDGYYTVFISSDDGCDSSVEREFARTWDNASGVTLIEERSHHHEENPVSYIHYYDEFGEVTRIEIDHGIDGTIDFRHNTEHDEQQNRTETYTLLREEESQIWMRLSYFSHDPVTFQIEIDHDADGIIEESHQLGFY